MGRCRKLPSLCVTRVTLEVDEFGVFFFGFEIPTSHCCHYEFLSSAYFKTYVVYFYFYFLFLLSFLLVLLLFSTHVCYCATEFQQITSLSSFIDISQVSQAHAVCVLYNTKNDPAERSLFYVAAFALHL